jgi:hypothetical protein
MKWLPKLFLAIAAVALPVGMYVSWSGAQLPPFWTAALPLGVISLGMFYITFVLQKEAARFDEEAREKNGLVGGNPVPASPAEAKRAEPSRSSGKLEPKHAG